MKSTKRFGVSCEDAQDDWRLRIKGATGLNLG